MVQTAHDRVGVVVTVTSAREIVDEAEREAADSPRIRREILARCVETHRRYLHMPDPSAIFVTLATVAGNRIEGDPLWVLLVGPPGGGKTEVLSSIAPLPDVFPAATFTEAALLSGTPKRDKAAEAKGGLLREIGAGPAVLLCKDFGSVLSMNRDARASVLAALREVYDGSWTRHLGTDGGRTLTWRGKVGLIGGVTPAIDSHHAVMGALGERFLLYRLPEVDPDAQAQRALEHIGHEREMRIELAKAAASVLKMADVGALTAPPSAELRDELVALATLAVRARSAVERDAYSRDVTLIPQSEAPARFALVLLRLWNGLRSIGVDEGRTRAIVSKAALDSMPQIRRQVLEVLIDYKVEIATGDIATAIGYPTTTTRRACEDLAGHGVVTRIAGGSGKADRWLVTKFTRERWPTVPEKSDSNGGVPEESELLSPLYLPLRVNDDKTGKVGDLADFDPEGDVADLSLADLDRLADELEPDDAPPPTDDIFEYEEEIA